MNQELYDHLPSWQDFVERVLAVLALSLKMLYEMEHLPSGEVELNLQLSRCIRRANGHLNLQRRGLPWLPSFDGIQGLAADEEEPSGYEYTRPDCRWGLLNMQETDISYQERNFDIECKRLGNPSSSSWRFNERYILDGVARFMRETHAYGRDVDQGAMIGYVQSMMMDDILSEVNECAECVPVTAILRQGDEWLTDINHLQHSFDRPFKHSPFRLDHFWVDLREHYLIEEEL